MSLFPKKWSIPFRYYYFSSFLMFYRLQSRGRWILHSSTGGGAVHFCWFTHGRKHRNQIPESCVVKPCLSELHIHIHITCWSLGVNGHIDFRNLWFSESGRGYMRESHSLYATRGHVVKLQHGQIKLSSENNIKVRSCRLYLVTYLSRHLMCIFLSLSY